MIHVLKRISEKSFHVVSLSEITAGSSFEYGLDADRRPITRIIESVLEQRKERGIHEELGTIPRNWASVTIH